MNQETQTPHKRRVRYKGKYPKKFEEKYKELQPEKYQDTIEHVISKGNTPAGMHISIMVKEIIDILDIQPGETGFDATLGYGGHTKAMLACLKGEGHMYATDVDPEESAKTKKRLADLGYGEEILTIKLQNFLKYLVCRKAVLDIFSFLSIARHKSTRLFITPTVTTSVFTLVIPTNIVPIKLAKPLKAVQ